MQQLQFALRSWKHALDPRNLPPQSSPWLKHAWFSACCLHTGCRALCFMLPFSSLPKHEAMCCFFSFSFSFSKDDSYNDAEIQISCPGPCKNPFSMCELQAYMICNFCFWPDKLVMNNENEPSICTQQENISAWMPFFVLVIDALSLWLKDQSSYWIH